MRRLGRNELTLRQPHCAKEYNKFMNGVDRHYQLRMSYPLGAKRWKESMEISFSNYENLNLEDKDLLVFLLDKFCVSDAAYHELSTIYDDMPRKYLLIQCREDFQETSQVLINLNSELQRMITFQLNKGVTDNKVQIKFSGDDTRVSRISNFVFFQ